MLQNRHQPTHPQTVVPAVTLPPPHQPTGRRLPNAPLTKLAGGTAGGSVELSVTPAHSGS